MNSSLTVRFSLLMFFQFFIWGVWYVPMWSYLGTLDVEASLRGSAYAATGVAAMISPFIVGMMPGLHAKSLWSSSHFGGFFFTSWPANDWSEFFCCCT